MTEVTTRESIPSQAVNRQPLPERDFITLCELVTWLATGKARSAAVLQRLMRRHRGLRRPTEVWRPIENEATKLIPRLRSRSHKIKAFGHVDHGGRREIPGKYLLKEVFAEPLSDIIAPDYLARFDLGNVPTYRSVCFFRTDVQRTFGIAGNRTAADDATARDGQLQPAAETAGGGHVGRHPASQSQAEKIWEAFDERSGTFTFTRGELALVAREIGQANGYKQNTVEKLIRSTYRKLEEKQKQNSP